MNKELDLNSQKEFFEAEKLFKEKKFNNSLTHYQNILKKFPYFNSLFAFCFISATSLE